MEKVDLRKEARDAMKDFINAIPPNKDTVALLKELVRQMNEAKEDIMKHEENLFTIEKWIQNHEEGKVFKL